MRCPNASYSTSSYYDHPLAAPLVDFHGKLIRSFDTLPRNGKIREVVLRILRIVAAPFAYLAFGVVALIGLAFDRFSKIDPPIPCVANLELEGLEGLKMALGGEAIFANLPELKDWTGKVSALNAPVMKAALDDGNHYFIFSLLMPKHAVMLCIHDALSIIGENLLYKEFICWNDKKGRWEGILGDTCQLNFRTDKGIKKGSFLEKCMFDRISRLMRNEPVGLLKKYHDQGANKPLNKGQFKPVDAYLKGKDLDAFLSEECSYYEAQALIGHQITLVDPKSL